MLLLNYLAKVRYHTYPALGRVQTSFAPDFFLAFSCYLGFFINSTNYWSWILEITDKGYILRRSLYGENNFIITIFSEKHGIISGLVKRALNKRTVQIYSLGNLVDFVWVARLENHLGLITAELKGSIGFKVLDSSQRLHIMQSTLDIISASIPERLVEEHLFSALSMLMGIMRADTIENLYLAYIEFELLLLKDLGFEMDLSKCAITGQTHDLYYISPSTGRAACREAAQAYADKLFLIDDLILTEDNICIGSFQRANKITAHFLQKFVFDIKHKKLPESRYRILG